MCERFFEGIFFRQGLFWALRACTGSKKPSGAGTKQCAVLLALALVCNFYLLEMFIIWSYKMQAFHARKLWHFLF